MSGTRARTRARTRPITAKPFIRARPGLCICAGPHRVADCGAPPHRGASWRNACVACHSPHGYSGVLTRTRAVPLARRQHALPGVSCRFGPLRPSRSTTASRSRQSLPYRRLPQTIRAPPPRCGRRTCRRRSHPRQTGRRLRRRTRRRTRRQPIPRGRRPTLRPTGRRLPRRLDRRTCRRRSRRRQTGRRLRRRTRRRTRRARPRRRGRPIAQPAPPRTRRRTFQQRGRLTFRRRCRRPPPARRLRRRRRPRTRRASVPR